MLHQVPAPARWLGLAGALPFVAGPLALWGLVGDDVLVAQDAILAYAAVSLSFVGAVHWGMALARAAGGEADQLTLERLAWGVAPAGAGWLAQLMVPAPAFALVMLGFWAALIVDGRAVAAGLLPGWYLRLRRRLTAIVVASLGLSLPAVW